ncbi:NAD(P)/FAD-dependent oxidoreductase [Actinoplanes sp. NPDC023714]|uniref:dihydrolipoyl dehydrogenase family protein n=1 Tax=Actinoplanes sp. NPDC023714 TaxID=3154322 RepID=UPI0033D8EE73
MTTAERADVCVVGAGPAGVVAALRAARLGARTALITRDAVGGMAATDGPVPVRVLAQAARLRREARHLSRYGIDVGDTALDYGRLLTRVREVVEDVAEHSVMRTELQDAGVILHANAGTARFTGPHTIEAEHGIRVQADKVIICAGGTHRPLPVPGADLAGSHRDAWNLTTVPESLLVIGAGATGAQVASVFTELGSRVMLFEAGPRILATEDEDVSRVMAASFRASGMDVRQDFGRIDRFEKAPAGVRMIFTKEGTADGVEATMAVVAIGWLADTAGLNLAAAGVATDGRGYVQVDEHLRTTAPHVFAAGDITGRLMLVPQAVQDGYLAATNAVLDHEATLTPPASPIGSFTDPEYAQVGLTEAQARQDHDVVVAMVPFSVAARPIIDGRPTGFCKLVVDRGTHRILGCHVVGERAVEIVQVGAVAVAAAMPVEQLVRIPLSFPTYSNVLGRAAVDAARRLDVPGFWDE